MTTNAPESGEHAARDEAARTRVRGTSNKFIKGSRRSRSFLNPFLPSNIPEVIKLCFFLTSNRGPFQLITGTWVLTQTINDGFFNAESSALPTHLKFLSAHANHIHCLRGRKTGILLNSGKVPTLHSNLKSAISTLNFAVQSRGDLCKLKMRNYQNTHSFVTTAATLPIPPNIGFLVIIRADTILSPKPRTVATTGEASPNYLGSLFFIDFCRDLLRLPARTYLHRVFPMYVVQGVKKERECCARNTQFTGMSRADSGMRGVCVWGVRGQGYACICDVKKVKSSSFLYCRPSYIIGGAGLAPRPICVIGMASVWPHSGGGTLWTASLNVTSLLVELIQTSQYKGSLGMKENVPSGDSNHCVKSNSRQVPNPLEWNGMCSIMGL
ncbi:hypothetical protein B0H11DRAFT_2428867 [Mycena galericulata]|nr:hypothetical protein B0H11DRAFT_2428867 [Mycena galericulata]